MDNEKKVTMPIQITIFEDGWCPYCGSATVEKQSGVMTCHTCGGQMGDITAESKELVRFEKHDWEKEIQESESVEVPPRAAKRSAVGRSDELVDLLEQVSESLKKHVTGVTAIAVHLFVNEDAWVTMSEAHTALIEMDTIMQQPSIHIQLGPNALYISPPLPEEEDDPAS